MSRFETLSGREDATEFIVAKQHRNLPNPSAARRAIPSWKSTLEIKLLEL